jgi:wobble nucleotide-excising tRNase
MVRKFVRIKHVGKFVNYAASGDVELRRVTLVHGDNGRGKTTLVDILRSFGTGDGSYVKGRSSLGQAGTPEITVRLEGETRTFTNNAWDQPYPYISVFDDLFVHDNVYAGICVEHEQRKNIYPLIIGAHGVTLARRVDRLDGDIREINKSIKEKQSAIAALAQSLSLDDFVALPRDPDVERSIAAKEGQVRAAERAEEIAGKPELSIIELPALPADLEPMLARHLIDVRPDAEILVRNHIATHEGTGLEQWLSRGMVYSGGPDCPFCGQPLTGSELIESLRAYFSQAYNDLKAEIGRLRSEVSEAFGEAAVLRIEQRLTTNAGLIGFWQEFLAPLDAVAEPAVRAAMETLRTAALACIEQKGSAPLEPILPGEELKAARAAFENSVGTTSEYNARIRAISAQIAAAKGAIRGADPQILRRELDRLRAAARRHSDPARRVCDDYLADINRKNELDTEKTRAKKDLDDYTKAVFPDYEGRLNALLEQFGADFSIGNLKTQYAGGASSGTYQLLVNQQRVDPGSSSTPLDKPSFRNTLSAGDRRTLALAFFLAQLEREPDLAERLVVFDDPFTSLDKARRGWTQKKIRALAESVKQVIVLSHDPYFLKLIYDALPAASVKALHLKGVGQDTAILDWDIEADTREEYFQNHDAIQIYIETGIGEPIHVIRCMRPLLEKYLRVKFPREFQQHEWLGDFIRKIRAAQPGEVLAAAQPVMEDLEAVNDYTKPYHHDGDQRPAPEPIVETELQNYAKRTLSIIGEAWICPARDAIPCWSAGD